MAYPTVDLSTPVVYNAGMNTNGNFSERLRSLREAANLSQYALAKKSGLSKQAISHLELGAREPTWQTVQLLAAALGVDCTSFLDPNVKPPEGEPAKPRGRPRKGEGAKAAPKKGRKRKGE
jgi:transcriptional regulator with XRE-family HTH domain